MMLAAALANRRGPTHDLSGRDSADKLVLITEAAFGQWLAPDDIPSYHRRSVGITLRDVDHVEMYQHSIT
jgi:homoserine dehydrogenase